MRFDSLNIPAFGPFTSCAYEFQQSEHDLHVIYGENEAGKSSLLRGIHHLLYGFPSSTDDDFLHDYRKLRIGATISDGEQTLTFMRKKGNVGTLLDEHQNTIDEGKLKAFCGSVSPDFFTHMFGLSTDTLRSGADSLLSAQGELGALLFAASVGGSPIEAAIQKLQAEADKLFAGNGRKANTIVSAYTTVKEKEKESRTHSLSPSDWKKLNQAIATAQTEFDLKDAQLTDCRKRLKRVDNLLKAIPLIQELKTANADLAKVTLPPLASDFPARVAAAQSNIASAIALINENQASLLSKTERLSAIIPFQTIVADAPEIDSLHQTITRHLDDIANVEVLKRKLDDLQGEQERRIKYLNLDDGDSLAVLPEVEKAELSRMKDVIESIANAERERDQARRHLTDTGRTLTRQQEKLEALGENNIHHTLLELSSQVAEHNQNIRVAADWQENYDIVDASMKQLENQLGIVDLNKEEARRIQVPPLAVVEQFQIEQTQLKEDLRQNQKKLDDFNTSCAEIESEIQSVSDTVGVLSEEELSASRLKRDQHWDHLAQKLTNQSPAEDGEAEAFSREIAESDQIADALRDHAETIGQITTLQQRRNSTEAKQKQAEAIVARIEGEQDALETQWHQHACFLPGRHFGVTELGAWLIDWEKWRELESEQALLKAKLDTHQQSQDKLHEALRDSLDRDDSSYEVLSKYLNDTIKEAESINGERRAIRSDLETLTAKLQTQKDILAHADEDLESSLRTWDECTAELMLDNATSRTVALKELEERNTAHKTAREIKDCTQQIESLMQRMASYIETLEKYRSRHLPDSPVIDPVHPDIAEKRLAVLVASAKIRQTEFKTLTQDIEQVEETLRVKEKACEAATAAIDKLIAEAKLTSQDELSDAITEFELRNRLQQKLEFTNAALTNLAGSLSVDVLTQQADAEDSDALHVEVQNLEEQIEALQADRDTARDLLKDAKKDRDLFGRATDDAALAKQLATNALATVITDSERFIRLQHSISFLRDQIEAYRKNSQGPMIQKTSAFFNTLTNGSFSGVAAQQDEQNPNQINLVALRNSPQNPDATPDALNTQALSEGTRDQLYLALRMAAIDIHLDHHAAMPLILDDVLMTFDDSRSHAFFQLMKKLSEKTQVIIFTHHHHTAKMAEQFVSPDQILSLS